MKDLSIIRGVFIKGKINNSLRKLFRFLLIVFMVNIFFSCDNRRAELERLEQENEEMRMRMEENAENVEGYFAELNEIEDNLRLIKERENIISDQARYDLELGVDQQARINEDIQLIGELMEKNRILIASLNNRLRNADTRIEGFEQMIRRLNQTLEEKEVEIQLLRDQLAQTNLRVDYLTAMVDTLELESREKSRLLREQTLELNAAYYAMGSRKELVDNNIIEREGGFLGIGRSERLKSDFNPDFFTRIDITRDHNITIYGNRPELITSHPNGSYEFKSADGENWLEITDPERFWSASRYLVIQVR